MSSTNTIDAVRAAAGRYAAGQESTIRRVAEAIDAGGIQAGKDTLRTLGYSGYTHLLDRVVLSPTTPVAETVESFDRATAAQVIRAFIQDGVGNHPDGDSYDEAEVTALLQIAGLEDVPEPVVEAEPEAVDAGLFARLVSFARGHGFRG